MLATTATATTSLGNTGLGTLYSIPGNITKCNININNYNGRTCFQLISIYRMLSTLLLLTLYGNSPTLCTILGSKSLHVGTAKAPNYIPSSFYLSLLLSLLSAALG